MECEYRCQRVRHTQLKATVIRNGKSRLSLKDDEHEILVDCLDTCTLERISLSRFCLFLGV